MPFFSIVMPVWNRAHTLKRTFDSLAKQTFTDYEILLADGGSKDGTPELALSLSDKVRVITQPPDRPGIGAARSIAFGEARGEYIACLDSDDVLLPWALQTYYDTIVKNDKPAFILANAIMFRDEAKLADAAPTATRCSVYPNYFAYIARPRKGWSLASGSIFRTEYARQIAGLSDKIVYAEDSDMFIRLGDKPGFVRIEKPFTFGYRQHDTNVSINFDRFLKGMHQLIEEERAGLYPGGAAAAKARRNELTSLLRSAARRCINRGRLAEGWDIYRKTLAWNIQCNKWPFIASYPLKMMLAKLEGKKPAPAAPATITPTAVPHQNPAKA